MYAPLGDDGKKMVWRQRIDEEKEERSKIAPGSKNGWRGLQTVDSREMRECAARSIFRILSQRSQSCARLFKGPYHAKSLEMRYPAPLERSPMEAPYRYWPKSIGSPWSKRWYSSKQRKRKIFLHSLSFQSLSFSTFFNFFEHFQHTVLFTR